MRKRGECAISTQTISPDSPAPDAQALTDTLRAALDETISRVNALRRQEAAPAADALSMIRDSLTAPPEACAGLPELDKALLSALSQLPDYFALAPAEDIHQAAKLLRRILLSDRCRIDPDPRRQAKALQMSTRQAQLLERRISFLLAQASLSSTRGLLERITDPGEYELVLKHLYLLEGYCRTHEEYIQHLQDELRLLQAELQR